MGNDRCRRNAQRIAVSLAPAPVPGLLTALVVTLGLALLPARPAAGSCATPLVGYYSGYSGYALPSGHGFSITDLDVSRLTVLDYIPVTIEPGTLTCKLVDTWADLDNPFPGDCPPATAGCLRGNFHQIELLKAASPALRAVVTIGGAGFSDSFSDAALTAAARGTFVRSCVDLLLKGQFGPPWDTHAGIFDGIDLDWEFPVESSGRPQDTHDFTLLLQEFRSQLDALGATTGRSYSLSAAVGVGSTQIGNLEPAAIAPLVDWLNLMTYEFHDPAWETPVVTNFNAPLYRTATDPSADPALDCVDGAVGAWLATGFPAAKMRLGMPFYGLSWAGVGNSNNGLYQPGTGAGPSTLPGSLDYSDIVANYLPAIPRYFQAEAMVPWLYDGSVFISYEDAASIAAKAAYVHARGLGGAMVWELGNDLRGVPAPAGSLLAALDSALCPAAPGRIPDLKLTHSSTDLSLRWTLLGDAPGGYHLYQTDLRLDIPNQRSSTPGVNPFATVGATGPLPFLYAGGLASGRRYFQVLGVASDGLTEGPN